MSPAQNNIANACAERDTASTLGAADVLALAAAPTFAVMALLTSVIGSGQADMICSAAHGSALSGMVPMYVLMCAFHLAPWLGLIVRWRGRRRGA